MSFPLDQVTSIKVKLGVLVAASAAVAAVVGTIGSGGGVPAWLGIPVTIVLALAVTQLLAVGMTSPLREMTGAARRMARGDYSGRVTATSSDEVGELARAFNRMAEDLATVDRERRALVATVSHELRTPLAALCAVLENLVDGVAEPDPAGLQAALDQAERLSALVSDLLDLSRVDAGVAPLTEAAVPVAELLDRAVAEAAVIGREVSYEVVVNPPVLRAYGDPARLRQLVANLLDNASRHSPPGGSIRVEATLLDDRWWLEVTDQGPGVPAADRERVFERFTVVDPMSGAAGGGTGLGLAIARWVTDLHGGSITFVDPPAGQPGARVRVDLPLHPAPRPARSEPAPAAPVLKESTMPDPTPPSPAQPPLPSGPPTGPSSGPSSAVAVRPTHAPGGVPVQPQPALDVLFGSFWPEEGLPASLKTVLGALGVGVLAAIVFPFRDLGLGTTIVLLAAGAAVLVGAKHRREPFTLACAALCGLLALVPTVRDAEWIAVLCMLAGAAVCGAGLVAGRTLPSYLLAGIAWPLAGLRGLPWLGRSIRMVTGIGNGAAVLRTAIWSVLAVVVFGLLFASADALFAEWAGALVPDLDLDNFVLRAFITCAVGGVVLAAAYLGLNPPRVPNGESRPRPVQHRFEWLAPVLLVDAVFITFLVAQATVIFGGHGYLERTTGLTYADYVHQGFGQLTVATALTLLVVWAAARKAPRETAQDRLWIRASLGLLCVLTLVVVASALYRMHVYQEAYGFTRLRLLVDVFEAWLGLLVVAMLVAGRALSARWLPRLALLTGAGLLLGIAAINPDAWVAQRNLDRFAETGKVDWYYLGDLSDDAVPTLVEELPADQHACALGDRVRGDDDWLEWNLGRHRAFDHLSEPTADQISRDVGRSGVDLSPQCKNTLR